MSANPILMPKLGLTMTEGLLVEWRVGPGDEVRAGDVMFAVETDKITSEVEARDAGRIEEIRVPVGETVPVGAVVATWSGPAQGVEGDEAEASSPLPPAGSRRRGEATAAGGGYSDPATIAARPKDQGPPPAPPASGRGAGRIIATPYARKLAREAGIGLDAITGSGPDGRIKAGDVEAALAAPAPVMASPVTMAAPVIAMAELDLTAIETLCARIAEAGESAMGVNDFLTRAVARSGHAIALDEAASARAWLLPQWREGDGTLALGPTQPLFRPDANGQPALRHIASIALAAGPALDREDAARLLDALVHALENPLKLLL